MNVDLAQENKPRQQSLTERLDKLDVDQENNNSRSRRSSQELIKPLRFDEVEDERQEEPNHDIEVDH